MQSSSLSKKAHYVPLESPLLSPPGAGNHAVLSESIFCLFQNILYIRSYHFGVWYHFFHLLFIHTVAGTEGFEHAGDTNCFICYGNNSNAVRRIVVSQLLRGDYSSWGEGDDGFPGWQHRRPWERAALKNILNVELTGGLVIFIWAGRFIQLGK